jgi:hypothetical protein
MRLPNHSLRVLVLSLSHTVVHLAPSHNKLQLLSGWPFQDDRYSLSGYLFPCSNQPSQ